MPRTVVTGAAGFMTPVAGLVALAGLVYLTLIGWRLTPVRNGAPSDQPSQRLLVFELTAPMGAIRGDMRLDRVRRAIREAGGSLLALVRDGGRTRGPTDALIHHDDCFLVMSRVPPWEIAPKAGLLSSLGPEDASTVTAHVSVGYGSTLVGEPYSAIAARSGGNVHFVAAGPRAARLREPLAQNRIDFGDQLYLRGTPEALARLIRSARLLEIDREAGPVRPGRHAVAVVGIYALAVLAAAVGLVPTTAAFLIAALAICMMRLIPADEAYRAIDLPVIVLLAGLIPIGREFNEAGGSQVIAQLFSTSFAGAPLFLILFLLGALTIALTIFLNNVATAIVMGQVGIEVATALGIPADAALIMVLITCSCDFLTPIGHQNNMMVMRPGDYRFVDYPKVGAPLSLLVLIGSAAALNSLYG